MFTGILIGSAIGAVAATYFGKKITAVLEGIGIKPKA